MDALSSIFDWLREQEAGFSAVAAILTIAVILFAGVRALLRRRAEPATEKAPEEDPLLALPTGPTAAALRKAGLPGMCGIHTHFYNTYDDPPDCKCNLACCEDIDLASLEIIHIDGKSF